MRRLQMPSAAQRFIICQRALLLTVLVLFTACTSGRISTGGLRQIPSAPKDLGAGEIALDIKKPVRWVLPNGLVVLYRYDDEVPIMAGQLYLRGGSLFDPPDLAGLSAFVGSQMREGSTTGVSPEALDQRLDSLGAKIESNYGSENGKASFSCLVEDFPEIFRLFSHVVRTPSFDSTRLALAKKLAIEGIQRRKDSPETMASMSLTQLVYGSDNPFGRAVSIESVSKIERKELQRFHNRFVRPNGALLALVGAVPENEVRELVSREFGGWIKHEDPLPNLPAVGKVVDPGIYVLKRDLNQATVFMGHLGPRRLIPESYAISLFNKAFSSGGFESTLFSEIRSKLGLVYMIEGGIYPGPVAGLFEVALATRNEQVVHAVGRVIELIREARLVPPAEERLVQAKTAVERRFVFNFAESLDAVGRAALLEVLEYPSDYDEKYLDNIAKVTASQVTDAAERFVWPEKLVIVIVGGVGADEIATAFGGQYPVYQLDFDTAPRVLGRVSG